LYFSPFKNLVAHKIQPLVYRVGLFVLQYSWGTIKRISKPVRFAET